MQKLLSLVGLVVLFLGALPYLVNLPMLSFLEMMPSEGSLYQWTLVVVGGVTLYLGLKK